MQTQTATHTFPFPVLQSMIDSSTGCYIPWDESQPYVLKKLSDFLGRAQHRLSRLVGFETFANKKAALNERQYAERVGQLCTQPGKLKELVLKQNGLRCQFANIYLAMKFALPADKLALKNLSEMVEEAARYANNMSVSDALSQVQKTICINNCLVAKKFLSELAERISKIEFELGNNASLASDCLRVLKSTFCELDKVFGPSKLEIREMDFIDDIENPIFLDLQIKFRKANSDLHQLDYALGQLRKGRGDLHEAQYVRKLEQAATANDTTEIGMLNREQQRRRCTYQSYAANVAWQEQRLKLSIAALKTALPESLKTLERILAVAKSEPDSFEAEDYVALDAMKSNCITAQTLIASVELSFTLGDFQNELKKDPSGGEAEKAFEQALVELLNKQSAS